MELPSQYQHPNPGHHHSYGPSDLVQTAVPSLKVMRLQSPELAVHEDAISDFAISNALRLPESFGVIHIGETFTAYIGVLNTSNDLYVRGLCVTAQLQTPSKRVTLPSNLENAFCDVVPGKGRDFLVSHALEEAGQHILRLEVSYLSFNNQPSSFHSDTGGKKQNMYGQQQKTIRKFYRFNVNSPMNIKALAKRGGGDASIFVSISATNTTSDSITIHEYEFQPPYGLVAEKIESAKENDVDNNQNRSAVQMYDVCGILKPGSTRRYLFLIKASTQDALLRGIAVGDVLGHAVFSWKKGMGESGRIASATVHCPSSEVFSNDKTFVVHGSGLSVDVAASAASHSSLQAQKDNLRLDTVLPVTVEPIDPQSYMNLYEPQDVQLLVVNHSEKALNIQLQMRSNLMKGLRICGKSFQNLGEIRSSGGSCVITIKILPIQAGLFQLNGCVILDLVSGREIPQPPLFHVFVESSGQ